MPQPQRISQLPTHLFANQSNSLHPGQAWGWNGFDSCRAFTPTDVDAGFHQQWSPKDWSWLDIFLSLFPCEWLQNVLIEKTDEAMKVTGERKDFTFGEFLLYIGLWLLMATCGQGFSPKDFWTTKNFD